MKKGLILSFLLMNVVTFGFSQSWAVNNVGTWIEAVNGIRTGGNDKEYTITVTGTVSVPAGAANEVTFGAVTGITVTMEGSGTLTLASNGRLLMIGDGQTVIAKDLTLKGRDSNNAPVVSIGEGTIRGGIFHMEGNASVTGNANNQREGGCGGVYVGERGTFTMSDGTITGNTGSGVYTYGTFTMSGGTIAGNTGSGVSVRYRGTFTMSGGEISGNTDSSNDIYAHGITSCGGVYVHGTFTMSGGEISGNTASATSNFSDSGGGVYVRNGGTFTMSGGKISGNNSSSSSLTINPATSGGGVYVGGTFTMEDGEISGNTDTSPRDSFCGGGVYVSEYRTFTMRGGKISGNTSSLSGGGVSVRSNGTFTMVDGEISGNTTAVSGGGVWAGTFTMSGGEISGNTAAVSGGGVYAREAFTMSGGEISGNTAAASAGGVWAGTFTKTGGTVYGDDAEPGLKNTVTSSRWGHALYENREKRWRNAGAGPAMGTDSYGFWLNDGDPVMFPEGIRGYRKRSNFNNRLEITEKTVKASNSNYVWVLQRVSGNAYTLKRGDAANTITLTIRLDGSNLVISGDSGSGQDNWNGTWSWSSRY